MDKLLKEIDSLKDELQKSNDHRDLLQRKFNIAQAWKEEDRLQLNIAKVLLYKASEIMGRGGNGKELADYIRRRYVDVRGEI